jgi:hypothetical protein
MDGISACGSRSSSFSREDEEDLRKEPTTAAILDKARRDGNVGGPTLQARGDDKTWRMTKEEQNHVGVGGMVSIGHVGVEAAHMAEFHMVETATAAGVGAAVGAGVVIGGAAAGLALGIHEWAEAHHKGDEQRTALAKDELHVVMLTHLKLPDGYKAEQLAARSQAGQGEGSAVSKMTTAFATLDKPWSPSRSTTPISAHTRPATSSSRGR